MKKAINNQVAIYQSENGALQLKKDLKHETIWASLNQIAELFDTDKSGISRHINNIYKLNELSRKATVAKFATVQKEGKREITRELEYFNLDVILSVGYRVNSKKATHFRQWATKTLKIHIIKGYSINRHRIKTNYDEFCKAVADVKSLLFTGSKVNNGDVLELITLFADTWLSLDAFDKGKLITRGATKKQVALTTKKLNKALMKLKQTLVSKGEAADIFGVERTNGSVAGIIGNVMQSFAGQEIYPTIEEKAAHLLYFMVKDHPYLDGNKRSGAYSFIWFLQEAKALDITRISPPALTALTLLIAESPPKNKDKMIGLICSILAK